MGESFRKEKRKRSACLSSAREDIISKLPDSLICEILSYIPTKESVRASVLSKRWKSVWLLVPGLDLDTNEFADYKSFEGFVEKFQDLCKEEKSCLHNLNLHIRKAEDDPPCVTRWIDFVATPKLRNLDIECDPVDRHYFEAIPASLYICESLIYLRLHRVFLGSFESVSLPRLKTVRLELNAYANETCLESLISSCPVLEDLSIVRRVDDGVKVLRVHSQTLTTLSLGYDFGKFGKYVGISSFDTVNSGVLIDAPRLKYLNFSDEISQRKIISNLDSLAHADFAGFFHVQYHRGGAGVSKNQLARDFFTDISRVRNMIISAEAMKFFFYPYLEVESLPQFCNMSFLEAGLCACNVKILPTLLQSCPNLKSIVLDLDTTFCITPMEPISFSSVPQCLLSSLKFAEIKNRFSGSCVEVEVGKYFVENSVVLNKLVVHLSCSIWMETQSLAVLRNLQALSKPSSVCQIVYVADADS